MQANSKNKTKTIKKIQTKMHYTSVHVSSFCILSVYEAICIFVKMFFEICLLVVTMFITNSKCNFQKKTIIARVFNLTYKICLKTNRKFE